MKKKLNDWLKKNNKENISAPFNNNGDYDVNGKYEWHYYLDIENTLNTTSETDSGFNPGIEEIIKGIVKHHNIKI